MPFVDDVLARHHRFAMACVARKRRVPNSPEVLISDFPRAELHAHTTFSDGELTPEELVAAAADAGLAALAVTDHDIVAGVAPARAAAATLDLEIVGGVEFSANIDDHEIHVLGLFIDETNPPLVFATRRARDFRRERAVEITARLGELGIDIEFETIETAAAGGSIGRPHIAQALVHHGASKTVDDAFRRLIGVGRPAFIPKPTLGACEVIDVVHRAGGVAILAHPASSRVSDDQIHSLVDSGLDGFEVDHPKHGRGARKKLRRLIERLELLPSGGSDFHGPGSGRSNLGDHAVPIEWMEAIRAAAISHRTARAIPEETT